MGQLGMSREAMKLALEALENPNSGLVPHNGEWCSRQSIAITALRAALAEPEQEPVAWRTFDGEGGWDYRTYEDNENYRDEYIKRNGEKYASWVEPLYTAPTPRKPLTDEEIAQAMFRAHAIVTGPTQFRFAKEIERAHGIGEQT